MITFCIFIGSFFTFVLMAQGIDFFRGMISRSHQLNKREEKMRQLHSWLFIKKSEWM